MDLNEASKKLSSLQESIPKLDPVPQSRSGGAGNMDVDVKTDTSVKRFDANMDEVGEMVRRMPEDATDIKVKSAEDMAEKLRQGEVPEDFGKRQVGPAEESKKAWEAWDEQQNLPKRGNTHMDSAQSQSRQEFLEKSGLADVDNKINKAWDQAKNSKLDGIIADETNKLTQRGVSPDADDFQTKLSEGVQSRQSEKYDCWDDFQNNIRQMEDGNQLQPTDYSKWESAIGRYESATDVGTGQAPSSFGNRSSDFD